MHALGFESSTFIGRRCTHYTTHPPPYLSHRLRLAPITLLPSPISQLSNIDPQYLRHSALDLFVLAQCASSLQNAPGDIKYSVFAMPVTRQLTI
jgi:hypothetical protein